MKNEITIKPESFGLDSDKVSKIEEAFSPKIAERKAAEEVYKNFIGAAITEELSKDAGDLRKKLVKIRTGIAEIHRTQKAYFLAAGKFCDAWKNKETEPIKQMEENLSKIENHFEILKQKEIENLEKQRVSELENLGAEIIPRDLGTMDASIWESYLSGVKHKIKEKKESEEREKREKYRRDSMYEIGLSFDGQSFTYKDINFHWLDLLTYTDEEFEKALEGAKNRKAQIDKEEKEEQERIRKENQKLKREAAEKEAKRKKEESKRLAKEKKEREAREKKEKAEREAYESKLRAEREEKEKIEAELRAKKEAEERAEKEAEEKRQSELNKGDADKVKDLISDLESLKTKYSFKSNKNKKMYSGVSDLLEKVISYIKK